MKISQSKIIQLLLLSLVLILTIGCSGSSSPSNVDVETAIKKVLIDGKVSLKEFEIGVVQGEGSNQYWEVKVLISAIWSRVSNRGNLSKNELIFKVFKDGYDVWVAKRNY